MDGFFASISNRKRKKSSYMDSSPAFHDYLDDYSHIIDLCRVGEEVPPVSLKEAFEILQRLKPEVPDYESITSNHFDCEKDQQIESLLEYRNKFENLEDELSKLKVENTKMQKKIIFTRKATEQRICENITDKNFYRDDPLLVAVLSATLNEDDFDFETDENMEQAGAELGAEHVSRKEKHFPVVTSRQL